MHKGRWWIILVCAALLLLVLPVEASPQDTPVNVPVPEASHLLQGTDVWISKSSGTSETMPGRSIRYYVTFGNLGPDATNVTIRDTLPRTGGNFWLTWEWDNGPTLGFARTHGPGAHDILTWTGQLNPGETRTIEISLLVSANISACQVLTNVVCIDSPIDTRADNNCATFVGPRIAIPDLGIRKMVMGSDGAPLGSLAVPGDRITYTVIYSTACNAASGVVITDVLPAQVSFVSASPAPADRDGNTLIWQDDTLSANTLETIQIVGQVSRDARTGDVLTNRASISNDLPENNLINNTAAVTITVGRADVTLAKSGPATAIPRELINYVLTYRNTGSATARGLHIVDTLPQGMTYQTASVPPSLRRGRELHWDLSDLAPGITQTLTINARVDADQLSGTVLTNTAAISTTTPEDNRNNNAASWTTRVLRADLWLLSERCPGPVIPGDTITYRVAYSNVGVITATNVLLVNCFPDEVDYAHATVRSDPAYTAMVSNGRCYTLTLPNLAPNARGWAEFTVDVNRNAGEGQPQIAIANETTISTEVPESRYLNNAVTCETDVNRSDIALVKQVAPISIVMPNSNVTFTLSYVNNGATVAQGVMITDVLPISLTYIAATPRPTTSQAGPEANTYTWNVGPVAPGAGGTITLTTRVAQTTWHAVTRTLTNTAWVTSMTPESDLLNHAAAVPVTVSPGCPARLTLVIDPDRLPADGASTTNVVLTATDSYTNQVLNGTEIQLTTTHGQFAANGGRSIVLQTLDGQVATTLVAASQAAVAAVRAEVIGVGNGGCDIGRMGTVAISDTVTFEAAALSISKVVTPTQAIEPGDTITYTVRYTNSGPGVAMHTLITDVLPAGFIPTVITSTPEITQTSGNPNLQWSAGNLPSGATGTIMITGRFDPAQSWEPTQQLSNCAAISSRTDDPNKANNAACTTSLLLTADVWVVQQVSQARVHPGDELTWTIVVSNSGPAIARNVVVTDTLPPGTEFVNTNLATYTLTEPNTVVFNVGNLGARAGRTITLVARVLADEVEPGQTLENRALVDTTTQEYQEDNNESWASALIEAPDIMVYPQPSVPICEGRPMEYRVRYENRGNDVAENVVMTVALDSSLQVLDTDPALQPMGNNTYQAALGTMARGDSGFLSFICQLPQRADPLNPQHALSTLSITTTSREPLRVQGDNEYSDDLVVTLCQYFYLVYHHRDLE